MSIVTVFLEKSGGRSSVLYYDPDRFPSEIHDYFLCKFPEDLWALEESYHETHASEFEWQLHAPFWKTKKGYSYNLCPIEVLLDKAAYDAHYQRILAADVSYPLTVSRFGGRLVILDGLHRLSKLHMMKADKIRYGFVPASKLGRRKIPL